MIDHARYFLLLCVEGYQSLSVCFPVAETVLQGLLVMATEKGFLSITEARKIRDATKAKSRHHRVPDSVSATWIADLDTAITNRDAALVETLATRFQDIAVFDEYTTIEDSNQGNLSLEADRPE